MEKGRNGKRYIMWLKFRSVFTLTVAVQAREPRFDFK